MHFILPSKHACQRLKCVHFSSPFACPHVFLPPPSLVPACLPACLPLLNLFPPPPPLSLPPSLRPSLPPTLLPSLPLSLSPSLPLSLSPSLPPDDTVSSQHNGRLFIAASGLCVLSLCARKSRAPRGGAGAGQAWGTLASGLQREI